MHQTLVMSLNREEFFRLLPAAVGPHAVDAEGLIHGPSGGGAWTIRLTPLEPLSLGSVVLPRCSVEISLNGFPDAAARAFLARFHRGFQRGGG
jgi:hypothetical protein